ncbi:MAG: cytidine deaminase [Ferruginibacter sp.]|nr:cytidine deaminase [Ferruginibacter sp.]
MKKDFAFSYDVYQDSSELSPDDRKLLEMARKVTANAYAPYSQFLVGAAARMSNGNLIEGTNQENASFPVGLCAERVLLSTASSLFPQIPIDTMAVSYKNLKGHNDRPISPCGICRQSLLEYESRGNSPIKIILSGQTGEVVVLASAKLLLPFSFDKKDME